MQTPHYHSEDRFIESQKEPQIKLKCFIKTFAVNHQ